MRYNSSIYGEFEYNEGDIVNLTKSLPGFDCLKKFALVNLKEYEPFKMLQSLEDKYVGLIVISPFDFFEEYEIDITEKMMKDLEIEDLKDVLILTTVTLNSDPKKVTTNLRAPIIINNSNRLGEQIILDTTKYKIKHPLSEE